VLLDIDAEFEDCKPTGKVCVFVPAEHHVRLSGHLSPLCRLQTGLSFYSSVLVAAKTLTLTGKKLAEYWVNRYAAIAKVRPPHPFARSPIPSTHAYHTLTGRRHRQGRPGAIPADAQDRSR
jgi:hypothetical protein